MVLQTASTSGGQTQGSLGDIPHSNNNILLYYILYDIIIIVNIIIITNLGTRPDYVGPRWPGTIAIPLLQSYKNSAMSITFYFSFHFNRRFYAYQFCLLSRTLSFPCVSLLYACVSSKEGLTFLTKSLYHCLQFTKL